MEKKMVVNLIEETQTHFSEVLVVHTIVPGSWYLSQYLSICVSTLLRQYNLLEQILDKVQQQWFLRIFQCYPNPWRSQTPHCTSQLRGVLITPGQITPGHYTRTFPAINCLRVTSRQRKFWNHEKKFPINSLIPIGWSFLRLSNKLQHRYLCTSPSILHPVLLFFCHIHQTWPYPRPPPPLASCQLN